MGMSSLNELEIMDTKLYKKLSSESGKEYAREFINKSQQELKEVILRFMVEKNKVTSEMEANPQYSLATAAVKKRQDLLKDALSSDKLLSDLALEVLERLRDDSKNMDPIAFTKAFTAAEKNISPEEADRISKTDRNDAEALVVQYQSKKKHLTAEMKAEGTYQGHVETVKDFKGAAKDKLKPQKLCADLAIEILKNRGNE